MIEHGKPVDILAKLHFNSYTETDAFKDSKAQTPRKHQVIEDEMVAFDKKTFKFYQNLHFQPKAIKFVFI